MPLQSTGLPATMPMGGTTRSRKRKSGGNKTLWIALGVAVPVVLFGVIVAVALNSGNENSDPVATGDAKQQNQSAVTNSRENQPKGPAPQSPQAIKKGSTQTERTKPSQQTASGNSAAGRNNSAIPAAQIERIRKALTAAGFEPFTAGKIELLQLTATTLKKIHDAATALAQRDQLKQLEELHRVMLTSGNYSLKPPNKRVARKYAFPLIQAVNAMVKEYKRLLESKEVPDAVKLQIERTVKGVR